MLLEKDLILNLTLGVLQSKKGPSNKENRLRIISEIRGLRLNKLRINPPVPSFSLTSLITRPTALFTFTTF